MKVAIVVGHGSKGDKGASAMFGLSEYFYNLSVSSQLPFRVFRFDPKLSYYKGCKKLAKELNGFDLALHLHFNSFEDSNANGCEAIYWHSNIKGKKIADEYIKTITEYYDTKPRRSIPMCDKSQRGYYAIQTAPCTALILEPFFGSNVECKKFVNYKEYAEVLTKFVESINKQYV